jgi:hypothetical protein
MEASRSAWRERGEEAARSARVERTAERRGSGRDVIVVGVGSGGGLTNVKYTRVEGIKVA